jgi:hypothetical protein
MTDGATRDLVVTRLYNAPLALVWRAWSDPSYVMQWWGPEGFTCPLAQIDFREGEMSLVCIRSPEYGDHYSTWRYERIVPMQQIAYQKQAMRPLPSGRGTLACFCLLVANSGALRPSCARALNPCVVGFGPVLLAPSHGRGVAEKNPSRRNTVAVSLEAFTELGAAAPSRSGGHPARSSLRREAPCLSAWAVSLLQHLEALEQEAEEKGGVHQLLADHFTKVYKVTMPLAA